MIMRYYYNYDLVWGENPKECVDKLNDMDDETRRLYATLGQAGYDSSRGEQLEVILEKVKRILDDYGCHIYALGETWEDLQKRGELELYQDWANRPENK